MKMTNEELWQAVLARLQLHISKANFITWFKNTKIHSNRDGEVIISVPNAFSKEWIENKYHKFILKTLRSLEKNVRKVSYIVSQTALKIKKETKEEDNFPQLDFEELKIDYKTNLNPRYTFENFVVGPFNEIPHAAALSVCEKPGLVYNPLFIYGGVGLGKTHLLQAIGNKIYQQYKEKKKIKYLSAEKLISEIVTAIRTQSIEKFKKAYQQIDILIVDDVQFLSGKEKTQEEFFHLFNALYEKNKQIVLSSDRLPKAIPALENRLRSRFEGGMIADIGTPDYETRIAILKMKAKEKKASFSQKIYDFIASNIKNNIRELEGALNRLIAFQKIINKPLDLKTVEKVLKKIISSPKNVITPKKIIKTVSEFYDLKEKDLLTPSRKKEFVKPRQIAMYLLRKELKESFPAIGRKFGGKDHTTVIYAVEKVSKEIEKDSGIKEEIELIKERLYNF